MRAARRSTTYARLSDATACEIARNHNAATQLYKGSLDDFGIWSEALDPKKIALINGLGRFSGVDLGSASIDNVLAVYNAGSGSATAGSQTWVYKTGLGSTTVGATGGSVAGRDAYIVLDTAGNGVGLIPVPTITLSAMTASENRAVGTSVGSFTMVDAGSWTPPITYSFDGGTDDGSFQLSGVGGKDLLTAAMFDKEAKGSYSIAIRATDSAGTPNTANGNFTITIADVAEPGGRMYVRGEVQAGQTRAGILEALPGTGDTTVSYAVSPTTYHGALFNVQNGNELHLTSAPAAGAVGDAYFVDVGATGNVSGSLGSMLIKVTVVSRALEGGTIFLLR